MRAGSAGHPKGPIDPGQCGPEHPDAPRGGDWSIFDIHRANRTFACGATLSWCVVAHCAVVRLGVAGRSCARVHCRQPRGSRRVI